MSFGSKQLDDAYDKWATQTPEDYFGADEGEEEGKCKKCNKETPKEFLADDGICDYCYEIQRCKEEKENDKE